MTDANVISLRVHFIVLSFLAVGGLPTVLLAMQRDVVDEQHWMTSQQFTDAYALAQVAPGPHAMDVTLIGWQVAGWAGAVATTLPLLAPVCTLMLLAGRLRARYTALLRPARRRGLQPGGPRWRAVWTGTTAGGPGSLCPQLVTRSHGAYHVHNRTILTPAMEVLHGGHSLRDQDLSPLCARQNLWGGRSLPATGRHGALRCRSAPSQQRRDH